jgi:hypothetical protein
MYLHLLSAVARELVGRTGSKPKLFGIGVNAKGNHGLQMLPSNTVQNIAEEIDMLLDANGILYARTGSSSAPE